MSAAPLYLVSGLSGAGRTTVVNALEDLGFYCVDNLPLPLLDAFLGLFEGGERRLAVVIDGREGDFLESAPAVVDSLRERGRLADLLFLEASDETLAQRFDETRRLHPAGGRGGLSGAIARERALLAPLADRADVVLDTSRMTVHDLRRAVARRYSAGARVGGMQVELISFGFRYGLPDLADLIVDVRFLANPHAHPELRPRTGEDPEVARFVLESPGTDEFLRRFLDFLDFLVPRYEDEGKSYLMIAIGCTGGQHRSVAVVAALERSLRERRIEVRVVHRDVWRSGSERPAGGSAGVTEEVREEWGRDPDPGADPVALDRSALPGEAGRRGRREASLGAHPLDWPEAAGEAPTRGLFSAEAGSAGVVARPHRSDRSDRHGKGGDS